MIGCLNFGFDLAGQALVRIVAQRNPLQFGAGWEQSHSHRNTASVKLRSGAFVPSESKNHHTIDGLGGSLLAAAEIPEGVVQAVGLMLDQVKHPGSATITKINPAPLPEQLVSVVRNIGRKPKGIRGPEFHFRRERPGDGSFIQEPPSVIRIHLFHGEDRTVLAERP